MDDGSSLHDIDVVVFCTGYVYNFPFLPCTSNNNTPPPTPPTPSTTSTSTTEKLQEKKKKSSTLISENKYLNISADGHCVNHLIGHVFPTPSKTSLDHLAFVGLPYNVVPFHLYELQSRWIGETILSKSKNQKNKNKNNENQKKENKTNVVHDSDKALAGNDVDAGTNVLPRKITSAVFASGDNDRHAHRLGDLQWEYCHSLLQELTNSNSSSTTTNDDDDKNNFGVKRKKYIKKQEEDVITDTNTDANTDAKQQDVHQQKKNIHDQPTQPSDVLNNATAEDTTYKGEAIGRFVVLLAPPTSNKYSSSSQTQILPVSIQSEESVHRVYGKHCS